MKIAKDTRWVRTCETRISELSWGRDNLFPDIRGEERITWSKQYAPELRRWRRRLFFAKYGYIVSSFVGLLVGGAIGALLLPLATFAL